MLAARLAPLGLLPVMLLVQVVLADRLPDPMATHFWGTGQPNGHQSQVTFALLMSGMWLVMWLAFLVVRRRYQLGHWGEPISPKAQLMGGYAMFGLLVTVYVTLLVVNLDVPTWRDTHIDSAILWLFAVGAGVGAYVGWRVARRLLEP